jgi:hypothetical protein
MATKTDEISIDIDALDAEPSKTPVTNGKEAPAVVVDDELTARSGEKETVTPDEGVRKLQKSLEDERAARIAADQRANEAARGEAEARTAVQASQLDQVKSAIAQLTTNKAALKQKLSAAMQAQDFDAAAEAQSEMADNSARLAQLEAGKAALERAPKIVPRAPTDHVEQLASQLSPRSAAWVRAHPQFARGGQESREYKQMIAAHELAKARGYKEDTDEYFASIEKTLDVGAPVISPPHADDPDPLADVAATTATGGRQAAPVAAPVTRGGGGNGSTRPNIVRLTPEEVEIARSSFPDSKDPLGDYARQKVALKKEGRLS